MNEAGAIGARAPRVPPLLGEVVHVIAIVCERPGMVGEPRIGVAEPSLDDGVWVELGMKALTYRVWIPLAALAVAP